MTGWAAGARPRPGLLALGLVVGALLLPLAAGPAAAQTTLRAQRGDGIWTLLQRAGIVPTSETIQAFKALNEGRLLRGEGLLAGRDYRIPEAEAGVLVEPLFGSAYERVTPRSDRLAGRVYYVVSGHGGPDPGAVGRYAGRSLPEDEVAYDVGLRLARRLMQEGATVYLVVQDPNDGIRDGARFDLDTDEEYLGGRPIVGGQARRLRDRVTIVNQLYERHRATARSQRLISLHVDARGSRNEPQLDVHFQVVSSSGERLARTLLDTFREQYARVQPGRGYAGTVEHRNLYLLRNARPVAVLVELGNIRHPRDQQRLTRRINRQALAEWLTRGLLREAEGG